MYDMQQTSSDPPVIRRSSESQQQAGLGLLSETADQTRNSNLTIYTTPNWRHQQHKLTATRQAIALSNSFTSSLRRCCCPLICRLV